MLDPHQNFMLPDFGSDSDFDSQPDLCKSSNHDSISTLYCYAMTVHCLSHAVLLAVQYSPNDVLEPRQESMLSDFGSDSDSDDQSDWDRFSSGEASSLEPAEAAAAAGGNPQAADARKKETSLFGVTDKRLSAPLKYGHSDTSCMLDNVDMLLLDCTNLR